MTPTFTIIAEKKMIGLHLTMSLASNKTGELWKNFMPRRTEILHPVQRDLFSLQIYPSGYFTSFDPEAPFEKWAGLEVKDFDHIPPGMDTLIIPAGLYAIFHYTGSSTDNNIYQYIFGTWLPQSGYRIAERPHFEVLGEKYRNNDPASEEEIWIPVDKI